MRPPSAPSGGAVARAAAVVHLDMTGRRRLAAAALDRLPARVLTGCPAPVDDRDAGPSTPVSAARAPDHASTDLPAYAGPPRGAPPSAGPLTRVRGAVDLTPATPGVFAREVAAVATPDGGARCCSPRRTATLPPSLVTVTPGLRARRLGAAPPGRRRLGACTSWATARRGARPAGGRLRRRGRRPAPPATVRTTVSPPAAGRTDDESRPVRALPDGAPSTCC